MRDTRLITEEERMLEEEPMDDNSWMDALSPEEQQAIIEPRPSNFVETPQVKKLLKRVHQYLSAGFPVHFRGPSGTGKTTLALHVAYQLGRPTVLIHGDEETKTSDLIGGEYGYHYRRVRDNFISSVLKVEESMYKRWMDNRLTLAVRHGFTLIYDEFTRARPEANNSLLSVLQEGVLDLPAQRAGEEHFYLKRHPRFTAIFTSNPEEYAGTYKAQDALRDRMVTLDLRHFDRNTEIGIAAAKSGLAKQDATKIVDVVRALRDSQEYEFAPTIRACIMIAKTLKNAGGRVAADDPIFRELAQDILASETTRLASAAHHNKVRGLVKEYIVKYC